MEKEKVLKKYPFTPELLDALPEELAKLYRGLEDTLLDEICSRLKAADQLNEVTAQEAKAASRKAQTEATNNVYAKFAKAAGVKYAFKWKKKKS